MTLMTSRKMMTMMTTTVMEVKNRLKLKRTYSSIIFKMILLRLESKQKNQTTTLYMKTAMISSV